MKYLLRFWVVIASGLLLAGCYSTGGDTQRMSFTRYQPIHINVADIQVIDEYQPPRTPPNVEHRMPRAPLDAVHVWVKDRLRAVGPEKALHVIIKNASVVEESVKREGTFSGIQDMFNAETRYHAKLEVEFRIYGPTSALSEGTINITSERSISIGDYNSAYERNERFQRLTMDLMERFNAEAEKNLFQHFGKHINFSLNP